MEFKPAPTNKLVHEHDVDIKLITKIVGITVLANNNANKRRRNIIPGF